MRETGWHAVAERRHAEVAIAPRQGSACLRYRESMPPAAIRIAPVGAPSGYRGGAAARVIPRRAPRAAPSAVAGHAATNHR